MTLRERIAKNPNNYSRAVKIRDILEREFEGQGRSEGLIDLLTDARHFADRERLDFFAALDQSYRHYLVERGLAA